MLFAVVCVGHVTFTKLWSPVCELHVYTDLFISAGAQR